MRRKVLAPIALFLLLASCGPSPQAGGGIGGTGSVATVASGPVTKFGSVFVSETEYDNTNTLYCIDHDPCSRENRLKIGMVVVVNGTRSEEYTTNQTLTRIADKIIYEETVEGEVQSVAADGLSLVVLGQVVSVNQKTEIDLSLQGAMPHTLKPTTVPGAVVEVSGFVTGDGAILATLIMPQAGAPHYEVEGFVKNHIPASRTFEIGSLVVDYAAADIASMPPLSPTSPVWKDIVVSVEGSQWSPGGPGSNGAFLTATRVKPQGLGVTDVQDAEVEDFITRVVAPGDFYINNLHVQTTSATTYEGGTANDLVIGAHVEVEGSLVNNILQAAQVSFKNETELESNIATIDTSTKTLTLVGFSGVIIAVDGRTSIQGNATRFEDLQLGNHLKIQGRHGAGGTILATEIEQGAPASKVKFEGLLTSASDPLLVVTGVTIDTRAILDSGFKGRDGVVIGRSAFFTGLSIGKKVAVQGNVSGMMVQWTSASRKD